MGIKICKATYLGKKISHNMIVKDWTLRSLGNAASVSSRSSTAIPPRKVIPNIGRLDRFNILDR